MASHTEEKTFRNYDPKQAATYAEQRPPYPSVLYTEIMNYHKATGGQFNTAVDVGCGPGNATRDLAAFFDRVSGVDPGVEMISQANKIGGTNKDGSPIQYVVAEAESFGHDQGFADGSVDLITSALAVHWFDMPTFWKNAARLLKKDGTVAVWARTSAYCHPLETPNAETVQKHMDHLEVDILGPYETRGNKLCRQAYRTLPLPWTISPPVEEFPEAKFLRKEWNAEGKLEPGEDDFTMGSMRVSLDQWEKMFSTASMVTRWREDHPDLLNTDQDCLKATRLKMEEALDGKDTKIRYGASVPLLMLKKI